MRHFFSLLTCFMGCINHSNTPYRPRNQRRTEPSTETTKTTKAKVKPTTKPSSPTIPEHSLRKYPAGRDRSLGFLSSTAWHRLVTGGVTNSAQPLFVLIRHRFRFVRLY